MRVVDKDTLEALKKTAEFLVTLHQGLKGQDLILNLLAESLSTIKREDIERALSEAVMENRLKRFEFKIPSESSKIITFYVPIGTITY